MGGGGQLNTIFLHIASSLVKIRLRTKNQLSRLPGSALKVCLVGGGVGWVVASVSYQLQKNSFEICTGIFGTLMCFACIVI